MKSVPIVKIKERQVTRQTLVQLVFRPVMLIRNCHAGAVVKCNIFNLLRVSPRFELKLHNIDFFYVAF